MLAVESRQGFISLPKAPPSSKTHHLSTTNLITNNHNHNNDNEQNVLINTKTKSNGTTSRRASMGTAKSGRKSRNIGSSGRKPRFAVRLPPIQPLVKVTAPWSNWDLPHLPLPAVADTLNLLLKNGRALSTNAKEMATFEKAVHDFVKSKGCLSAEDRLNKLHGSRENWLEELWLDKAYLKVPDPLPVNVTPAIMFVNDDGSPKHFFTPPSAPSSTPRSEFVSKLIMASREFYDMIWDRELDVDKGGKGSTLDMTQYDWLFATTRIPGIHGDSIKRCTSRSEHMIIMCRGQLYRIPFRRKMNRSQLERQIRDIEARAAETIDTRKDCLIGPATAMERPRWAQLRQSLAASDAQNADNFQMMDSAAMVLCLDHDDNEALTNSNYTNNKNDDSEKLEPLPPKNWNHRPPHQVAMQMLHGSHRNHSNRWYDKSVQLIVTSDGHLGLAYEHTRMEGIPVGRFMDFLHDKLSAFAGSGNNNAKHPPRSLSESINSGSAMMNEQAHIPPIPPKSILREETPLKLLWMINESQRAELRLAEDQCGSVTARSLDAHLFNYSRFGKDFPKKCGLSPDSFIQIALSLSYKRIHGKIAAQYETGTHRSFKRGRTETIRLPTDESRRLCDRQKAGADGKLCEIDRKDFVQAVESHRENAMNACAGRGMDRHLMALQHYSAEPHQKQQQQPRHHPLFAHPLLTKLRSFQLSTSQMVGRSGNLLMFYGPLVEDGGYAVCYTPKDQSLFFSVTTFEHSENSVSAKRFAYELASTLNELYDLFSE